MHILAAVIIFAGFFSQIFLMDETPEGTLDVMTGTSQTAVMQTKVTPMEEFSFKGITKQAFDFSCGSAALSTLLNGQFGETFVENQVIQGMLEYGDAKLITKRRAFSLLDMKLFVQKIGYQGNGYQATLTDLKELEQPGILPIKIFHYRHFVVFKGIYQGHVFFADPWLGNISFTISEFKDKWYEHVIFLVSDNNAASWNMLALSENDLRIIEEDDLMALMSDPLWQFPAPVDRSIRNGSGPMYIYKR